MKFVITVPDHPYYLWQVLVQINNFTRLGIAKDTYYIFGLFNNQPSDRLLSFVNNPKIQSKFYLFQDARINKDYTVSLSPHLLERFCNVTNIMQTENIFLTDPDVTIKEGFDLTQFEKDNSWYLSNTRSYVGVDYIKSKSPDLFVKMCNIVGIDPAIVEANDNNVGGAQYIMKNTNAEFWNKCYRDSEELYKFMKNTSTIYSPEYPIQAWTASMWSFLWNGWYFGHDIKVVPEMEFAWASNPMSKYDETYIFHNAGVTENNGEHFSKIHYQESPFKRTLLGSEKSASWKYIEEIKDTERNFPELIY